MQGWKPRNRQSAMPRFCRQGKIMCNTKQAKSQMGDPGPIHSFPSKAAAPCIDSVGTMRSSTRSQSPGIRRGSPALKQFLHREDSQSPGIRRGSPERARSMSPALKHYLHLDEGDYIYTPPAQVPPRSRSASPASYRQMRQAESSTSEALFPASAHTNASEQEDRSYEEEDEFRSSLASDHTLDFADEIEDLTTMDFKAMRLLVLTARHAKDLAVERAAALEMQMSKVAGSEKWNVAFTIVRRAISNYISDKFRAFHRWKHAVLGYHIHIQLNKHNSLVLKLALKSANKSHTMARAKAFTRWVLNSHRAREGASFSLQKIKRCRRILCLGWCRRAIAQWRQFVGAGYQQRLKSATLKAFLNRGQRSIREKKQQAVARWRGAVMGMKLKGMVNKRVVEVMRRFCSKEHDAFELWRRLVFVDMPKMQKVTGRFFELLSKCGIYHTRRAFNSWRSRVQGMIKCARKALEYMDNNVQWRMKAAFTCWTGLLRQHDKLQAMGAATTAQNRLKRQFLLSAGLKHRTACRSSLASRFHYWTFVTQAERFTHKVQQVHDFKIRGMEAQQEEMAQERAHMQQQLVDSKLKSVGRIIHTMLIAAVAKGFKQWLHVHRWHAHREAIHSVVLIDKRRRAQATLVRWMHRTHMVSLSFAMALWRFISTKESLADQILLRQRTRTFRTILQGWREVFRKRTLQRRVLRRMWRAFTEDLKGMAWEVWASKVRHLDAVSRQMGRLVVRKRAAFVRLAVNRWKGILLSNKKVGQQTRINSFERKHQKLCLRMEWQHWRSAFKIVRSKKQHVKQLVINKITQIIRHYLSRWHRQAVFLTRLQKACKELLLASLRATGRAQALAFSRWKFFVLEHTRAHLRSFTERHDQLQMNEQHLRGHNERADRIARTLYTQVNRMLVNRRTTYLLKSTFGAWKEDHLTKQHIKTRFRRFLLQSTASVETKELASAFRTWNVHAHHLMRDEEIIAHMHQTHREHLRRNTFVQWRSFTRTYRIHKRAVLTRIVFNATSQSAKAISSAFNTWKHNIHRHLSGQTLLLNKYFREWLSIVRISNKRNAQLCMVLHRSGLRLLACGVAVWKEASRKIGLVDEVMTRMMEVAHMNTTHVSHVRVRSYWSQWTRVVADGHRQLKACRVLVSHYKKILRTAVAIWHRRGDALKHRDKVMRLTILKLTRANRSSGLSLFYRWRIATSHQAHCNDAAERMGHLVKRLKGVRWQLKAWAAWRRAFQRLGGEPSQSNMLGGFSKGLRMHGARVVNATTRAQYWGSALAQAVLLSPTAEPVVDLALQALRSVLPTLQPALYLVSQDEGVDEAEHRLCGYRLPTLAQVQASRPHSPLVHAPSTLASASASLLHTTWSPHQEYFQLSAADLRAASPSPRPLPQHPRSRPSSPYGAGSSLGMGSGDGALSENAYNASRGTPGGGDRSRPVHVVQWDEGMVGSSAARRCLLVYRTVTPQSPSTHSSPRARRYEPHESQGSQGPGSTYCSASVPAPEHALHAPLAYTRPSSPRSPDPLFTATLPLVWGDRVVAVLQLSAPSCNDISAAQLLPHSTAPHKYGMQVLQGSAKVDADADESAHADLERRMRHVGVIARDFVDFSDIGTDLGESQSKSRSGRSMRALMLYQLLQLCAELEMDEEQCLGLVLLASNLAEVLGRNYPTSGAAGGAVGGVWEASQHTHASPHTPAGSAPHALHGSRSLRRDDFTLGGLDRLPGSGVGASGGGLGVSFGAGAGVGSGSMAGLALSLSRAQQGQQQSGAVEHALHAEVASLNHALARLQESRRRHQQGEEVALRETAQLRNSVDAERRQFQRLKHHAHKADLRLQSFEAQQAEIEKLNAIMRTAANALPH